MKRGLVIGRFMPLHKGHIALINFATKQCDELIVSMTYTSEDPIPGPLRFGWIKEEFEDAPAIKPEISLDDFDNDSIPIAQRMPRWRNFLKSRFPAVQVVFSSEEYGVLLAENLGIPHISFDPQRANFPVSSGMIREKPLRYWEFIARPAQAYFVKKICFYGPESTGKSMLAKKMAAQYATEYVPEVSREIVTSNDFTEEDIIRIGHVQTQRVIEKSRTANKLLFCDTDLITTEIYSMHYLKHVPPILFQLEKQVMYDQYFLFDIDVPWVSDGLRDLGDRRQEMFKIFENELKKRKIKYERVEGNYGQRESRVTQKISEYFT